MKRHHPNMLNDIGCSSSSKPKMLWDGCDGDVDDQDAGVDELLAVLGYKVKPSDMADMADSVHYNPSDLSTWLESMTTELDPTLSNDLQSIPGNAIYPPSKKQKHLDPGQVQSDQVQVVNLVDPAVLIDTQENGVRQEKNERGVCGPLVIAKTKLKRDNRTPKAKVSFHNVSIRRPQDEYKILVNNGNAPFEHVWLDRSEDGTKFIHPLVSY